MNVSFSNAATLVKYQKGAIVDEAIVDDLESQGCYKIKCYRQKKTWYLSSFVILKQKERIERIPITEPIHIHFRHKLECAEPFVHLFAQHGVWLELDRWTSSEKPVDYPSFNWIGVTTTIVGDNVLPKFDGMVSYIQRSSGEDGSFLQTHIDKFHTISMRELKDDWTWLNDCKGLETLEIQNGAESKISFIPFHAKELRTQTSYKDIKHLLSQPNSITRLDLKSIYFEDLDNLVHLESINVQTYYGGPWQLVPKQVTNLLIKGSHVGSGKSKTTLSSLT